MESMKRTFLAIILAIIPLATPTANDLSDMLHRTMESVAYVDGSTGHCTAWSVRISQWMTANHCVKYNDLTINGVEVLIVKQDEKADLALLQGPKVTPLELAKQAPELGDDVYSFGWPGEYPSMKPIFFHGVFNVDPENDATLKHDMVGIDSQNGFGMSGGPIVNRDGKVVGMTEAIVRDPDSFMVEAYSQTLKDIKKFLK